MTDGEHADRLPGNPALPARRQHLARLALGAMGYGRLPRITEGEDDQAQRDAWGLRHTHGSVPKARWRTCPPLPFTATRSPTT